MNNIEKTIVGAPKASITDYSKEELDALIENSMWRYCGLPCVTLDINGVRGNWLIARNEADADEAMESSLMRSLYSMPGHIAEITGVEPWAMSVIAERTGDRANDVMLSIVEATCGFPELVKWLRECGRSRASFLAFVGDEVKLPCGYLAYSR